VNIGSKPGEYIPLKRCRNAEIVARHRSAARVRAGDLPTLYAQLPYIGPEEATQFAEDLEVARRILTAPTDRWAS
jgi:hypothetical protein